MLKLLFCATDTKEDATGSRASSQSRQQSTGKADAEETDSSGAVGKAQRGSVKTAATQNGGAAAGASGSTKTASGAVSDKSALERGSASPSMKKQGVQEGNLQKVKTRADGQLTQGLAAADDVVTDGKASAESAAAKEKPLDRAVTAKDAVRLVSAAGSQKISDEQADSESIEGSGEEEESGEASVEGVGAARLQAARG